MCRMIKFELKEDDLIFEKSENYTNIYTLSSTYYYSIEEDTNPARLGNTLISLI